VLRALLKHASVVADVHEDVKQTCRLRAAVILGSTASKFSPVKVIDVIPVYASFRIALLTPGASKLIEKTPVPAAAATVTPINQCFTSPMATIMHPTLVVELHNVVEHTDVESVAVAVGHSAPKPRPIIDDIEPPVQAAFRKLPDSIGASKLTADIIVPIGFSCTMRLKRPMPVPGWHASAVLLVQDVV
jgi:hypothetical protein